VANGELTQCAAPLREAALGWFGGSLVVIPALMYLATFWRLLRRPGIAFTPAAMISAKAFIWHFHREGSGTPG
jgi:hypothetical protein